MENFGVERNLVRWEETPKKKGWLWEEISSNMLAHNKIQQNLNNDWEWWRRHNNLIEQAHDTNEGNQLSHSEELEGLQEKTTDNAQI